MKLPILSRRHKTIGIAAFFVIVVLILLVDYSNNRNSKHNYVVNHVSDTGEDEKPRRSKNYESPIDIVYKEILNENPDIQKLEEEIKNSKIEQYSLSKQLTVYKERFDRLYNSTQKIAEEINDSTFQNSMKFYIQLQVDKNSRKITELENLIKNIEKKNNLLNDKHVELKIELILKKIETLHQNELPGKKEYVDLLINQEKLISRTTPVQDV